MPRSDPSARAQTVSEGVRLVQVGDLVSACRCFEHVLKREPRNALALSHLGRVWCKLNQPLNGLPYLRQVVELQANVPESLVDLGRACLAAKQPAEAVASFQAAVALRPDWADAWDKLGQAQNLAARHTEAESTLRHALAMQPDHPGIINTLGIALMFQNRLEEAVELFLRAIALHPAHVEAWANLGNALKRQNRVDEALVAFQQAATIAPKNAEVRLGQSLVNLVKGNLCPEAWRQHEFRWVVMNFNPNRGARQTLWRGTDSLAGKSILLYAEQGLGDTIQFVRYAPLLAAQGATVHLEVQPPLKSLLTGFAGAASTIARGEPLPPFDFQSPLLSLPLALDTRLETIPGETPYLRAPDERIRHWGPLLPAADRLRVGAVWRGNPKHTNDANRSLPFGLFQRLFEVQPCHFVCLQLGLNELETAVFATHPACWNPTAEIADFTDTAAIIAHLDLIVTVDTSVAHLAGAMGKPVWLLLPFAPDWRWLLDRTDSPWYPTARLFRQPAIGDWDAVIAAVSAGLRQRASGQPAPAALQRQTA